MFIITKSFIEWKRGICDAYFWSLGVSALFWRREILFWSIFFSIIHTLLSKFYIIGSYFEIVIFLDIISNIQQSARVNSLSWCFCFGLVSWYLVEYVGDFAVRIQDHRILETCPLYTRPYKYTFYNTRSRNSLSIVGITDPRLTQISLTNRREVIIVRNVKFLFGFIPFSLESDLIRHKMGLRSLYFYQSFR